jgi:creatinine amidohydrolase
MAQVIHYETLTWPEVAALPRDIPMVLPLGTHFDAAQIAAHLAAETLCMLPALPYGWEGSVVSVAPDLLNTVVGGILSAPIEEGFTRLDVVHAGDELVDTSNYSVLRLTPEPAPVIMLHATPQRVLLVPCGHTEQHGYHLPMNTDTVIIGAITDGVLAAIPDEAESLPVLPYGVSTHRSAYAGTFNMGGRIFEDFMLAVIAALVERGADRFYHMSGHGGNCSFLTNIVKYAGERHRGIFAATTWLHTSGHLGAPALDAYRRSKRGGMGHAGELETAYLLHLRPDLCRMDKVVDETVFITTPNYYMDWIEGGSLVANPPWEDDTATGSYGAGSVATAENGQRWLDVAIREKIDHVREIHEQQNRRLAKRAAQANG